MVTLSTWKHGVMPNQIASDILRSGGTALDAVETAARYCEADESCMSVGKGGIPDELGIVTLDAAIMDHRGNCGSVAFVQNFLHPISIARKVMETTPHIQLAGIGAERFAETLGFERENLLTDAAKKLYEKWKSRPEGLTVRLRHSDEGENEYVFEYEDNGQIKEYNRETLINESHDTIGILGLDTNGHLAVACTTSGLAFKQHGRVGDSPIIGAGLYSCSDAAAVATGNGELVMRACSSFHIVEQIRQGLEPQLAIATAIDRIKQDPNLDSSMQVGFMALRSDGTWAAGSIRDGFQLSVATSASENTVYQTNGITCRIA